MNNRNMAVKGVYIQGHRHEMAAVIHARNRNMIKAPLRLSGYQG
jgi:hypothetical protein